MTIWCSVMTLIPPIDVQNVMVLYRTVFEILTPKVWNVFIESPDTSSDIHDNAYHGILNQSWTNG